MAKQQKTSNGVKLLTAIIIIFVLVWMLVIMPQRQKKKQEEQQKESTATVTESVEKGWSTSTAAFPENCRFKIGDTWEVPGQWKLTITGVRESQDRTPNIKKEPAAVYVVSYTVENTGWKKNDSSALYFALETYIKDSNGNDGYFYLADEDPDKMPGPTYEGETNEFEFAIGVDHAGDFKIGVMDADMNGDMQKALFEITV